METAPTSIEVILRPTLGQSDEPSDLRGSLSPRIVYSTWQSSGGHPSNYEPGTTLLNFSDRANHGERTPYSVCRILADEENQYKYVFKLNGRILSIALKQTKAGSRSLGTPVLVHIKLS